MSAGDYLNINVVLDGSMWAQTTSFPCNPSQYAQNDDACDFFVFGSQTVAGNPNQVR